jgi:hypothetical protein
VSAPLSNFNPSRIRLETFVMHKLIVLALLALTACDDPFKPGSLITDTRVIGARVEVEGDSERAAPAEGESAQVTLLLAAPNGTPLLSSWALVACLDEVCAAPLATAEGSDGVPTLQLTLPPRELLGAARAIQVFGVVCSAGQAADSGGCRGANAEGTTLTFALELATEQGENLNPDLSGSSFRYAGKELVVTDPGACPGPRIKADGKEHDLSIELGQQVRELYLGSDGQELREGLQISHFVTEGELERQFSFVEASDPRARPRIELSWKLPTAKHVKDGERPARLLTVVRDLRGGTSMIEHAICLTR